MFSVFSTFLRLQRSDLIIKIMSIEKTYIIISAQIIEIISKHNGIVILLVYNRLLQFFAQKYTKQTAL